MATGTLNETKKAMTAKKANQDFKVKDMTLAQWGRKEIQIAETEMPGLMALRREYAKKQR